MKYDKQDQQGRAASNERNPQKYYIIKHFSNMIVQSSNALSKVVFEWIIMNEK
jgi:hypothetical protein